MKKPNTTQIRQLRRFCDNLARRCQPSANITGNQIMAVMGPAMGDILKLDPDWELPWQGHRTADGLPKMTNEAVAKRLWFLLYPSLFAPYLKDGKTLRFEYVREGTCNPLMARPPSYIPLPLDTRIAHDKIVMQYGGGQLSEPDMLEDTEFEIIDDDWEDY